MAAGGAGRIRRDQPAQLDAADPGGRGKRRGSGARGAGVDGRPAARFDLRQPIVFSGHVTVTPGVRSLTPFFDTYGIILLIGSSLSGLRRRVARLC